jgi:hypothetical protein
VGDVQPECKDDEGVDQQPSSITAADTEELIVLSDDNLQKLLLDCMVEFEPPWDEDMMAKRYFSYVDIEVFRRNLSIAQKTYATVGMEWRRRFGLDAKDREEPPSEGSRIGGTRTAEQVEEVYGDDSPEMSDEEWRAADILAVGNIKRDNEVLSTRYDDELQRQLEGYFSAGGRLVDMQPVCQDLLKQYPEVEQTELIKRVRVACVRATSTPALATHLRSSMC